MNESDIMDAVPLVWPVCDDKLFASLSVMTDDSAALIRNGGQCMWESSSTSICFDFCGWARRRAPYHGDRKICVC